MVTRALTRDKICSALLMALLLWLCTLLYPRAATGETDSSDTVRYEAYYRHAWQLLKDNSLHEEKLSTLCDWEHKFDGQLDSMQSAESAVRSMFESFGDKFSYFRGSQATTEANNEREETGVVRSIWLPDSIVLIKVKSFHSEFVVSEMEGVLREAAPAQGYIVDLRDNPGGDIYQALAIAAMFIDKGKFATLDGRWDGERYVENLSVEPTKLHVANNEIQFDDPRTLNLTGAKPLVLLVNKNTGSAAEMLAQALRDNRRCVVVGERTFGKGVVQRVVALPGGSSLKIVFAKTYSPSGNNIQDVGLTPDVKVSDSNEQLKTARFYVGRHIVASD
jgi:hypothetical protein